MRKDRPFSRQEFDRRRQMEWARQLGIEDTLIGLLKEAGERAERAD
jgi:hypothetical protein